MKEQNFKNHAKSVFGYHRLGATGMALLIIGSFVNLYRSQPENLYSASLICLMSFILLIVAAYTIVNFVYNSLKNEAFKNTCPPTSASTS
jgi:membrane-bound ClpP family serine protease